MTNINIKNIIENIGVWSFSSGFMYVLFILIEKYNMSW